MTAIPVAEPRQTRRLLGRMLGERRGALVLSALTLTVASSASLVLPLALGAIVDAVIAGDPARLPLLIGAVAVAGVVHGVLTGVGRLLIARLGEDVLAELRERVVTRLLALPARLVERAGRGELVSRAAGDSRVVGDVVTGVVPAFMSAAFAVVVTAVGLGAIDLRFMLAAALAVPVQVLAVRRLLRRARPAYQAAREAEGERSQLMLESIDASDTVRAMGVSAAREARIDEAAGVVVARELAATRVVVRFWNSLNLAELIGLAAVLAAGFVLVRDGSTTVGGATAAALYFHALFGPIGMVLGGVDELQKAGASLARMAGVLQLPAPDAPAAPTSRGPVDVVLDDVTFAYDGGFALHDVSFTVPAGATAALVGASGAGKSTVAALVHGSLAPSAGRVRFGGDAVPRIGMAGQEPHVFTGTVADNLRLARPDADEAALREALDAVGALAAFEHLPEGLETEIGAGGHALGPVESQQLALARVLLHDPDVLVLDEATAASDDVLDRAVARLARGRTAITIAHRLDQAVRADLVVVMEHGRVVEQGPHAELLDRGGTYARLWTAWSAGRSAD
ncbi:ABC transporter ATP-binding protein [Microbacterium sp. No. 7]|uniref:ABC transporter ATP-binding protein n=1 Tax=Microbacterium sp. No. 7 TaxID=1714373 RepID=UPI0006D1DFFA|nr:ABC transporter ATP-binding protein [Microbacterium sp. No. 7]ALJ18558.1 hypothetical protein AOA12_00970 [Microbacterium sp. No. 7]